MTPVTNEQETVEIPMVELTRNTRGANSRAITFKAVGAFKDVVIERETKPMVDADGKPVLDEYGNQKRESLGKDAEGKLITIQETVRKFYSDGVLKEIDQALALVDNNEQDLLDCFVEGFNERQYSIEAGKDELDAYIADLSMDEKQRDAFKRTVRNIVKNGSELEDAANFLKAAWIKNQAKLKAAAEAKSSDAVAAAAV